MMAQKKLYNDQLRVVCDFLTESKLKTDYILSLFYDRGVRRYLHLLFLFSKTNGSL